MRQHTRPGSHAGRAGRWRGRLHAASEPTDEFELCSVSNEEAFSDFSAGE